MIPQIFPIARIFRGNSVFLALASEITVLTVLTRPVRQQDGGVRASRGVRRGASYRDVSRLPGARA
jgi:hypothetical protein